MLGWCVEGPGGLRVNDAPLKRKRAFCSGTHLPSPFIQHLCFTMIYQKFLFLLPSRSSPNYKRRVYIYHEQQACSIGGYSD